MVQVPVFHIVLKKNFDFHSLAETNASLLDKKNFYENIEKANRERYSKHVSANKNATMM